MNHDDLKIQLNPVFHPTEVYFSITRESAVNHHSTPQSTSPLLATMGCPSAARTVLCNSGPLAAGCCGNCAVAWEERTWIFLNSDFMGFQGDTQGDLLGLNGNVFDRIFMVNNGD